MYEKGFVMGPRPSEEQLKYYREGLACFLHFGMNTFTDVEWGDGKASLDEFDLEEFDFDGYVASIKELGFKRLIFTAKHHDGFCMWHTKVSDYHVGNTMYAKDFLAELSKACTKYDINMGIYLSPWDAHEKSYGTGEMYNEFYLKQIEEICSSDKYGNDGKFVEWWFDGAKDPKFPHQEYDFDAWMATVRRYNPNILMFGVGSYGGIHWVGNEKGYAMEPNISRLPKGVLEIDYKTMFNPLEGQSDSYVWSVAEADTCTTDGWFWHENEVVKSIDEMINIYMKSIGRGAVLLLNIAANRYGKIPMEVLNRVKEAKTKIEKMYENPISHGAKCEKFDVEEGLNLIYTFEERVKIHMLEIMESIEYGQNITDVKIFLDGEIFDSFESIGYNRLIKVESPAYQVRFEFKGINRVNIKKIEIYEV